MRLVNGDVNVYYMHDTLTPHSVRAASYGTDRTSGALVPEVGDVLHNFPGWTGTKSEAITVRVTEVKSIGDGIEAYEVHTTTITERPAGEPATLPDSVLDLIESLTNSDSCWFDHHGGCQSHGYLSLEPGEACPQQQAKDLVEAAKSNVV
jgi:hypothetical protein